MFRKRKETPRVDPPPTEPYISKLFAEEIRRQEDALDRKRHTEELFSRKEQQDKDAEFEGLVLGVRDGLEDLQYEYSGVMSAGTFLVVRDHINRINQRLDEIEQKWRDR